MPEFTELEWAIVPGLEEWAEVATYDAPGVGAERVSAEELERLAADDVLRQTRGAERGLEEMSRRAWKSCVVVSDSGGCAAACRLASMRPDAVQALALGHACLSLGSEGERAPINAEVQSAMERLANHDLQEFTRHALTQLTGGSYDEELASQIVERVPMDLMTRAWLAGSAGELIRGHDLPLLFVKHEGCLMFTDEGFAAAVAAFPEARTASVPDKPSVSEEFADLLREFCEETLSSA